MDFTPNLVERTSCAQVVRSMDVAIYLFDERMAGEGGRKTVYQCTRHQVEQLDQDAINKLINHWGSEEPRKNIYLYEKDDAVFLTDLTQP